MKIVGGKLHIDLTELSEAMSMEDRVTLIDHTVMSERLLDNIISQLVENCYPTGADYFNGFSFGGDLYPRLREKLTPFLPDVTRELIADLIQQRDQAKADAKQSAQWVNDIHENKRPYDRMEFTPRQYIPKPTRADIDAMFDRLGIAAMEVSAV